MVRIWSFTEGFGVLVAPRIGRYVFIESYLDIIWVLTGKGEKNGNTRIITYWLNLRLEKCRGRKPYKSLKERKS